MASSVALSSAAAAKLTSASPSKTNNPRSLRFSRSLEASSTSIHLGISYRPYTGQQRWKWSASAEPSPNVVVDRKQTQPLKIMISGAPASGKGTQCELIKKKFGLVHIAAGDLLRAEIAAGTENGKCAKEYMEKGMLVPDEIVVMMVKNRLLKSDAQENGWLLDGYPRSLSQAKALEDSNIHPDLFILLDVSEESLVNRVVGRRLDPVTSKIYHLKYCPPENEEIAARLTQRFDDTEEKVKLRMKTHNENVEAVLSIYKDITVKIDGNVSMEEVFAQIDKALASIVDERLNAEAASIAAVRPFRL